MRRLKASEVTAHRAALIESQGGVCALCGDPFTANNPAVLDHDHTTGLVRGALHRGCNAMLGHLENNAPRYFLTNIVRLSRFLARVIPYQHKAHGDVFYPSHRTADEKRILRNKRATAARKARKA